MVLSTEFLRCVSLRMAMASAALVALGACTGGGDDGIAPRHDVGTADLGADTATEDAGVDAAPEDVAPSGPGELVVDPMRITFSEVRMGEPVGATIALTNVGESPVLVTRVTLSEIDGGEDSEFVPGDPWSGNFEIPPNEFRELEVVYQPQDTEVDFGKLVIEFEDPQQGTVEVEIDTINAYADLDAPTFFRFGTVEAGQTEERRLIIYNRGSDPLTIENVTLSPQTQPFELAFLPNEEPPQVLERGEDFAVDMRYSPTSDDPNLATITITSNDPDEPTHEVALSGNDPSPCMSVTPSALEFGALSADAEATQELVVFNCSGQLALELRSVTLTDDAGGVFSLGELPELPASISPRQTETIVVEASASESGEWIGALEVTSSDETSSPTVVELRASTP